MYKTWWQVAVPSGIPQSTALSVVVPAAEVNLQSYSSEHMCTDQQATRGFHFGAACSWQPATVSVHAQLLSVMGTQHAAYPKAQL